MAKILLVEDDNNLREIYEARLMAEGYDIVAARDGEEALTVAMKERPDLIISDVMMPKISGFDMLDIIRSTEETKNAKVIMMTALSQAEDKERATKLGADRYLVKSQVTLEDVAKVAREVLAGDSTEPTTQAAAPAVTPPAVTQAPTTTVPEPVASPAPEPVVAPEPTSPTTQQTTVQPAPEPVTPAPAPDPTTSPKADDGQAEPPSTPSSGQQAVSPEAQSPGPTPPVTQVAPTVTSPTDNNTNLDSTETETTESVASKAMEAIMPDSAKDSANATTQEPIEDEQSAIAAQIESFIETNKTENAKETDQAESKPTVEAPAQVTEEQPVVQPTADEKPSEEKTKKKIIQPISDPNASKGPDLENLLKKEEEKQEMQEIAKSVAAQKSEVADERIAEAVLVKAASNHVSTNDTENSSDTPQVAITENGDLKVTPPPETSTSEPEAPATNSEVPPQNPVIPHQNGNNIDGVVTQPTAQPVQATQPPVQPTQQPENDPNSIAL